uniref:Uncharacterized protein LOC111114805 n=1 Tax=Crassostrea virginica TaxID=6565 RepID=A0A8B8C0A5_CRAVI|nr:uncharacterized protein LOC111114805 [Crassostrea virginica]
MAFKIWFIMFFYITCNLKPLSYGIAISSQGECPDGHTEGDSWSWGDTNCGVCSCSAKEWTCVSCAGVLDDRFGCYHEINLDALYPKCCPSLVCKGDPHFNQTKYDPLGRK